MTTHQAPTPSSISSPAETPHSLSERINIATRSVHSSLNKAIIGRLALALPPHTTNPSIYVSGILHILPIYDTFESLWQALLDNPRLSTSLYRSSTLDISSAASSLLDNCPNNEGILSSRIFSLLSHLLLPGLLRTNHLRADIRTLTGTPEHLLDAQIASLSISGRIADFIAEITHSVDKKPYVLVAYAWVLYMALFSGGRYVRASLKHAGGLTGEFWARDPSPVRLYTVTNHSPRFSASSPSLRANRPARRAPHDLRHSPSITNEFIPPRGSSRSHVRSVSGADIGVHHPPSYLTFFEFSGTEDGEDLKREFKKRVAEAEILLKENEKDEIIAEAIRIFQGLMSVVAELDTVCAPLGGNGDQKGIESKSTLAEKLQGPQREVPLSEEPDDEEKEEEEDNDTELSSVASSPVKEKGSIHLLPPLPLFQARDSVAIARERHSRNVINRDSRGSSLALSLGTSPTHTLDSALTSKNSSPEKPQHYEREEASTRPRSRSAKLSELVKGNIRKLVRFNTGILRGEDRHKVKDSGQDAQISALAQWFERMDSKTVFITTGMCLAGLLAAISGLAWCLRWRYWARLIGWKVKT